LAALAPTSRTGAQLLHLRLSPPDAHDRQAPGANNVRPLVSSQASCSEIRRHSPPTDTAPERATPRTAPCRLVLLSLAATGLSKNASLIPFREGYSDETDH